MTPEESPGGERPDAADDDSDEGAANGPESREVERDAESGKEQDGIREGGGEEEEERRPISVRDLMPSPSTRPPRRTPERGERGRREEDEGVGSSPADAATTTDHADAEESGRAHDEGEGGGESQAAASVPTPVRVAMDAPPPGDSRPPEALPSRRFEVDGEEWIVRISGRTITGTRPDPGALLMHLSFFRPEEPETPARSLIAVDRPLDALYEEDLREFFDRSRPAEREATGRPEG